MPRCITVHGKKLILEDVRGLGQAIAILVNASTNPCAGCHERDRKTADLQAKLIALEKRLKEVEEPNVRQAAGGEPP